MHDHHPDKVKFGLSSYYYIGTNRISVARLFDKSIHSPLIMTLLRIAYTIIDEVPIHEHITTLDPSSFREIDPKKRSSTHELLYTNISSTKTLLIFPVLADRFM